jgi:two-component system OmpR family response regulator
MTQAQQILAVDDASRGISDFDGWKLDRRRAQLISPQGQVISLGRTDHQVLCALLDRANCEVSREYLVERIFQKNYLPTDRAIDMSISRLRRHLEGSPAQPQLIRTVRHVGYMLMTRVEPGA